MEKLFTSLIARFRLLGIGFTCSIAPAIECTSEYILKNAYLYLKNSINISDFVMSSEGLKLSFSVLE